MQRLFLPLACLALLLAGCKAPVLADARDPRATPTTISYSQFIARRSAELRAMGGPFKDEANVLARAQADAAAFYGEDPTAYTRTWKSQRQAQREKAQADVDDYIAKEARGE